MTQDLKKVAYRIQTERLVIRCWNPKDAPLLKKAVDESLEHLQPWMPWTNQEPEPVEAKAVRLRKFRGSFDLDEDYLYGIFNQDETEVVGATGLHTRIGKNALEIGYWTHVDHINQGLATEVAAALTKVAFEVNRVSRVEIHCDPENVRSARIPEKLGFVMEAVLRNRTTTPQGDPRDTMIWSMFADDYVGSGPSEAEVEAFDVLGKQLL